MAYSSPPGGRSRNETGKVPLSKVMQGLQLRYTGYYNRKYQKGGHLFQGRYKAILCDRFVTGSIPFRSAYEAVKRLAIPMTTTLYLFWNVVLSVVNGTVSSVRS